MPADASTSSGFVRDPRHAFSYEVRPSPALDAELRAIAHRLDADGLLRPGASTAPRFHPHLTFLRAAVAVDAAARAAAQALTARGIDVAFTSVDVFGAGRIVYVQPFDRAPLDAARAQLLSHIDDAELDPLALDRELTPHVTLAYAVPEDHRAAARAQVEAALPIEGMWGALEVWSLDERPTRRVARVPLG
ncbi:MAG: 2'-5' RNA ligase family protein [Thermoleophilia bacterium]|nr:2'-5' RNA ligase family protein [Thermoleophilia bacterium]